MPHGFEYFRHGTLSLYAALETRSGQLIASTARRHTSQEFVRFLQEVVATQPSGKEIHLIVDNLSAHKTKRVERLRMPWLSDWVLQQPVCDSLYIRDSRSKDPPRA
jgi:hypothetical protein